MGRPTKFTPAFKAKVSIDAIQEQSTLAELANKYQIAPSKIAEWKDEFLRNASQAFEKPTEDKKALAKLKSENERLLKKVGQMAIDCDFFARACEDAGLKVR